MTCVSEIENVPLPNLITAGPVIYNSRYSRAWPMVVQLEAQLTSSVLTDKDVFSFTCQLPSRATKVRENHRGSPTVVILSITAPPFPRTRTRSVYVPIFLMVMVRPLSADTTTGRVSVIT